MNGPRGHRVPQHRSMEMTCRTRRAIHPEVKETLYRVISQDSHVGKYSRYQEIQDGDRSG